MSDDSYRLPAYPKRTIREKQGSHGDLSNWRGDFSREERAAYRRMKEEKDTQIKEWMDAWDKRNCKPKTLCYASCPKLRQCPFGKKRLEQNPKLQTKRSSRIVFTHRSRRF